VAALSTVPLFLGGYLGEGLMGVAGSLAWLLLPLLFTVQGAVIMRRRPGNTIAWLLMIVGFGALATGIADAVVANQEGTPTFWENVAMTTQNGWLAIMFPILLLLFLFPTGRFLTPRWRWAGRVAGIMVGVFLFYSLFSEEWGSPETWMVDNPIGFIPRALDPIFGLVFTLGILSLAFGGVAALVVRFRRADITERTQIKWFLYAAVVFALGVAVVTIVQEVSPEADVSLILALALAVLPVSITMAITRYRLFEIDRLISRTFGYAIVVGVLGTLYFGLVTLTTELLPSQNALAVAGSTLTVAAVFNPFRKRIQHRIDRRFNRSSYNGEIASAELSTKLRASLTTEDIGRLWTESVQGYFQPSAIGIWIGPGKYGLHVGDQTLPSEILIVERPRQDSNLGHPV
jgi:hypothetical protein